MTVSAASWYVGCAGEVGGVMNGRRNGGAKCPCVFVSEQKGGGERGSGKVVKSGLAVFT